MAKFYLNEFRSQTPGIGPGPQGAQVPVGPYKRSGEPAKFTAPQLPGVNARVQNIDIAKHIPSLMQRGLPENLSNQLVGGTQKTGLAWAGAAESLGNLASTIGEIAMKTARANEIASKSTAVNLINSNYQAYAEEVANNRLKATEAYDLLINKYQPQLDEDLGSLKLSRDVLDEIGPLANLRKSQQRTQARTALNEEQYNNRTDQFEMRRKSALQNGDIEDANEVVHERYAAGDITLAVRDGMLEQNKDVYLEQTASETVANLPRASIQELQKLQRGEKSEFFPDLKNKVTIDRLLNDAYQTNHKQEQEAEQEIRDKIVTGEIKSKEDVSNVSKGRLDQHRVDAYAADLTATIPLDYEKVAEIRTLISSYNPKSDRTFQQHNEITQRILTETPKPAEGEKNSVREKLYDELAKRETTVLSNSTKPTQEHWDRLKSFALEQTRAGLIFGDPKPAPWYTYGYGPGGWGRQGDPGKAKPMTKLDTAEARQKVFERYDTAVRAIDDFLVKNPDATVPEVDAEWAKVVGPEALKSATERIKEKARGVGPSAEPPSMRLDYTPTDQKTSSLNPSLINSVKELEGFNPAAYWDSGQYSIGYGTRGRKGEQLTEAQADERLAQELTAHASNVDRAAQKVGLVLTEGQRNALISFDFNTGQGDYLITSSNGNLSEIVRRLPTWNKEEKGGRVSKGLVNRRLAELRMFNA